ncbi:signal peptidase I [Microbacterium sp. NPDC055903]
MTHPAASTAHRLLARTVTTLLVVAVLAMAGWFAFSAATGATIIVFRTGSMSPTMPQGAAAVSLPVDAAEIRVGDVVTVQGDQGLPITHRVVEVREPAAATAGIPDGARELVLKGDDNETVDVRPSVVENARRVALAVPFVGSVIMLLQSPVGMGTLTVLAGAIATWAFWPRRRPQEEAAPDVREDADADATAEVGAEEAPAAAVDMESAPAPPQTRRERREAGMLA